MRISNSVLGIDFFGKNSYIINKIAAPDYKTKNCS